MATNRDIKYLNKDFSTLRTSLIDYAKTYFPTTYNDFSPSSPGMMFMEMAAYVGDVMSFYLDNQIQETYLQYARQTDNLFELSYMFGYKPNVTGVATTTIDVYQQVPSKLSGSVYIPDFDYALLIAENAQVTANNNSGITFLIQDSIDFSVSSSQDPTEVTIFQTAGSNPVSYLLKKSRQAISSTINTTTFNFGSPVQFDTVNINSDNIVGILDAIDSDGNNWYEVDYLAQDAIYTGLKNTNPNDPNRSIGNSDTPYILQLQQVQRRFATRFLDSGSLQIQFGAGTAADTDENIVPNPNNVGLGLPFQQSKLTTAFSPTNFIFTKTYGIAPSNTTLTVRYLTGGGVASNVSSNTLTQFVGTVNFLSNNLNATTANTYRATLAATNPNAAAGGTDGDTIEEIRQNTLSNYQSQLRNVTQDDYLVRALSMPSKYGVVSKAYIEKTKVANLGIGETPTTLDLYVLTYDRNKHLVPATTALKQNLVTYLEQYRIVGDSVRIKDAFVVNIGVNFDIVVAPNFNSNQVLSQAITAVQNYFLIENWQINQPILLKDITFLINQIPGVQAVQNVEVVNLTGQSLGYSNYSYDAKGATVNSIVYPSIDPMIFEVKYPTTDIKGRVVSL
tara:strand:- start:367 stop:2223 length:1857 start_codon:yes stop_codon:yes gene_type:complete